MKAKYQFEIYRRKTNAVRQYDWRLVCVRNGKIMSTSHGQGFNSPSHALRAICGVVDVIGWLIYGQSSVGVCSAETVGGIPVRYPDGKMIRLKHLLDTLSG